MWKRKQNFEGVICRKISYDTGTKIISDKKVDNFEYIEIKSTCSTGGIIVRMAMQVTGKIFITSN